MAAASLQFRDLLAEPPKHGFKVLVSGIRHLGRSVVKPRAGGIALVGAHLRLVLVD